MGDRPERILAIALGSLAAILTALQGGCRSDPSPQRPPDPREAEMSCRASDPGNALAGDRIRLAGALASARLEVRPIRLGPALSRRLLDRGWDLKRADRKPGEPIVLVKSPATLRVPVVPCQAAGSPDQGDEIPAAAWVRLVGEGDHGLRDDMHLSVSSAGTTPVEAALPAGSREIWLEAPRPAGAAGGAIVIAANRNGEMGLAEIQVPLGRIQIDVENEYRDAIVGSSVHEASFRVVPPAGGRLRFSLGLAGGAGEGPGGEAAPDGGPEEASGSSGNREGTGGLDAGRRRFSTRRASPSGGWVFAIQGGPAGEETELFREIVQEGRSPRQPSWLERSVDLSAWEGSEISLTLEVEAVGDPESLALWGSPVVEAAMRGAAGRPNILMISLDTLRADRVGRVSRGRPLTPEMERLGEDGTTFTGCRTQAPSTLYGHGAMLTGLPPAGHGATTGSVLPPSVPYLPEVLSREGYATVALTDDGLLDGRYGFARGFDRFRSVSEAIEEKTALALEALERMEGPWFLLFHSYTAHVPYAPPPEFASLFVDDYAGPLGETIDAPHIKKTVAWMNQGRIPVREEDLRRLETLYDGEVRRADHALGRIFRWLREKDLYDRTVVVVTSDHGEELNEHGVVAWHALTCYEELMRVPLIIKPAGGAPPDRERGASSVDSPDGSPLPGHRVETAVRIIDIAPTILELAGLDPHAAMIGRSLTGLMGGNREPDRLTICEVEDARGAAILHGGWKYHMRADWSVTDPRTPRRRLQQRGPYAAEELYHLLADPTEQVNLVDAHPERAREMRVLLQARLQEATALLASLTRDDPAARVPREDAEHLERLRALGYVE